VNGGIWVWGTNLYGELGLGGKIHESKDVPTLITSLKEKQVRKVVCGGACVFAFGDIKDKDPTSLETSVGRILSNLKNEDTRANKTRNGERMKNKKSRNTINTVSTQDYKSDRTPLSQTSPYGGTLTRQLQSYKEIRSPKVTTLDEKRSRYKGGAERGTSLKQD
jgi:hypothetical protein